MVCDGLEDCDLVFWGARLSVGVCLCVCLCGCLSVFGVWWSRSGVWSWEVVDGCGAGVGGLLLGVGGDVLMMLLWYWLMVVMMG